MNLATRLMLSHLTGNELICPDGFEGHSFASDVRDKLNVDEQGAMCVTGD